MLLYRNKWRLVFRLQKHCELFSSPSRFKHHSKDSGNGSRDLSRTERRLREKKLRKLERKQNVATKTNVRGRNHDQSRVRATQFLNSIGRMFRLKVPGGGNLNFRRHHLTPLLYRVPVAFALYYLLTNENYFPYVIQGSIGPSMLPTIQFIGDLWLVETWAWHRLFGIDRSLQVGDIVLWKDPKTQRVSCKRIIGLEGDEIARYGEYASLYQRREDWGIVMPTNADSKSYILDWDNNSEKPKSINQTMVVPIGHVWLEGDCPLFSLDSRHYGPIPTSWLHGRLRVRIWPLYRKDDHGKSIPRQLSPERPIPFSSENSYLGPKFNFYKVPKEAA
eukprot:scaffold13478_cov132-Cylindrotheca_fusiformis.AAC.13